MEYLKPYFNGICILIFAFTILFIDYFGWFTPKNSLKKGIQYFEDNNYVKAIEYLSQATRSNTNDITARFYLGAAYHQYGWHDDALKHYHITIELAQNAVRSLHSSARIYRLQNHIEQATIYYRKALAINPTAADIWFELGTVLNETGNKLQAQNAFDKALQLDPKNEFLINSIHSIQKQ